MESRFLNIIDAFPSKCVLVVGDVMLDEYIWGDVRRISPEAPVPVVEVSRRSYSPGGAANVAANVVGLGGRALLTGVVGRDREAEQLCNQLQDRRIPSDGLFVASDRPTTAKTRIVAHSQQVVRLDAEKRGPLETDVEDALLSWIRARMNQIDSCIISDYGKGVISAHFAEQVICLGREAGKPVVVDPKGRDYLPFYGATVVTPNVLEAERAVNSDINGHEDILTVGQQLVNLLGSALLITRGSEGMSLFEAGREPVHIPAAARKVYDVTGAGDTVVSTLALGLAAGATLEQAAWLANQAAGIVVGKLGTATATASELMALVS